MAIVIRYMCCLVFISRSSDLIQYGGIVTKANTCSAVANKIISLSLSLSLSPSLSL